jgi:hypothetical protein
MKAAFNFIAGVRALCRGARSSTPGRAALKVPYIVPRDGEAVSGEYDLVGSAE